MSKLDTSMGGGRDAFPETAWAAVLSRHGAVSEDQRAAFERLCALYWRPVYKYMRAAYRKSVDDAKELTQGFFCDLFEDGSSLLERYKPEQGRFRTYLKGAIRMYLARKHREATRLKAGGGRLPVSLDDVSGLETRDALAELERKTPDELFDRQWARDLLAVAIARLKREFEAAGKPAVFAVYEHFELHPADAARPSHEEISARLGIPATQVNNFLHLARTRLRALITEQVAQYAATPEERDDELRDLFGS